jgi:hypothetical protein
MKVWAADGGQKRTYSALGGKYLLMISCVRRSINCEQNSRKIVEVFLKIYRFTFYIIF